MKPRIICLDIETSPIIGYTWTTFEANVLKVLQNSKILSVAWKDLSDEDVTVKAICDYKGYKKNVVDDKALVKEVWDVLDKADVVIAHHGVAFDIKKLNTRFVYHGLSSPSTYKVIDTLQQAKKYFKFDSNSLNNLGVYLGVGEKISHNGFSLWEQCMAGDAKAWETMKAYNAQDVLLLEKVYMKLRPYMETHPDLSLMTQTPKGTLSCGTCLSTNVSRRGYSVTKTGKKQRLQCQDCGSWTTGSFERTRNDEEATSEA